jgi:histidinol-phosphatase (PHP family)
VEVLELVPEADLHVHSEWSWDASEGAMEATCRGAQELGIRVVAFTEHADYSKACGGARLEVEGYLEAVESCRKSFPRLSIWTGVELGEPHRHQKEAEDVLDRGQFDLVLGSVHTVVAGGASVEISELGPEPAMDPDALMQSYCDELIQLIDGPIQFEVLAHLEYPRRYWPAGWPCYESADHWKLIQEVLAAAAHRGLVLEFNTTRGGTPTRSLCPSPEVLGWWRQSGGKALSFGSDAHDPAKLAAGFKRAAELAAQAGFKPSLAQVGMWSSQPELPPPADRRPLNTRSQRFR